MVTAEICCKISCRQGSADVIVIRTLECGQHSAAAVVHGRGPVSELWAHLLLSACYLAVMGSVHGECAPHVHARHTRVPGFKACIVSFIRLKHSRLHGRRFAMAPACLLADPSCARCITPFP